MTMWFSCRILCRSYKTYTICLIIFSIYNIYIFSRYRKPTEEVHHSEIKEIEEPKLVWLEQLPYGDRIRAQMDYVPEGYDRKTSPIIRILLYNGVGASWEHLDPGQTVFLDCPVSQCMLTLDHSLGSEVEVVLFRHSYVIPRWKRPLNQIWIVYQTESPHLTNKYEYRDGINFTADYRWDSDIPNPYGYFMEQFPPLPQIERNYAENKTKKVAWFVSNCSPSNKRYKYAVELAKYISVDIYGKCGNLTCSREQCYKMLETDYKFYLAFENAHCLYYVTEKYFTNSLCHDVLPIVMGPPRKYYELMGPKNSFIHVDDFDSPELLARYLHEIDQNDTLYNEYFKWKGTGTIMEFQNTKFYCRLCAMMHDKKRPSKHYEDILKWWSGPEICGLNDTISRWQKYIQ